MSKNTPQRTCVVCRTSKNKEELFRLVETEGKIIYDKEMTAQARGFYVCKSAGCLKKFSTSKKYKPDALQLSDMGNDIKEKNADIWPILKIMKNGRENLVFGFEMSLKEIAASAVSLVIIAEDAPEKQKNNAAEKCVEKKIEYIYYGTKVQMGEVFERQEVNMICVRDEKAAAGLLKKINGKHCI